MPLGDVYRDASASHGIDPATPDNSQVDLNELLTVDEVAALLKVSRSWVYEHSRSKHRLDRIVCHTSKSVSTCGSSQAPCARFFNGNAEQLNRVPGTRYNRTRAKPRRANERKGLSNGSTKTTIRKRMSSLERKGVGDSLAGD